MKQSFKQLLAVCFRRGLRSIALHICVCRKCAEGIADLSGL